jgi:hypothetical protein
MKGYKLKQVEIVEYMLRRIENLSPSPASGGHVKRQLLPFLRGGGRRPEGVRSEATLTLSPAGGAGVELQIKL